MKTCHWRNALPRSILEGLFANRIPEAHYGMKQCRDKSCRFCYERLDLTHRFEKAIMFSTNQIHIFVNKYAAYLNCNVVSYIQ